MSQALAALKAVTGGKPETPAPKPEAKTADKGEAQASPELASKAEKLKAIEAVAKTLNAKFKTTNSIIRLDSAKRIIMPHMPTGIASLDWGAIGIGGIPRGRIIEVYGPESSGKTTSTLQFIAEEQAAGGLAAFVDAEHALDTNYARAVGVNIDELLLSQPDSGEQALETVDALVRSKAVSLIIVDSVAALTPQAELDGDMGDANIGLQARMMSQAMRKLRGICDENGVTVIFINQIREKVGVMFGSPEVTTGGKALKFYASVRIDIRRVGGAAGKIMEGTSEIGYQMKMRLVKNKVGVPFGEVIVDNIYGKGIDKFADTVRYAVKIGAIDKAGTWLSFGEEKLGQGVDNAVLTLRDNPALMEKIKEKIAAIVQAQFDAS